MLPGNPRVRSGRYMKCSCDYCGKSSLDRELEEALLNPKETKVEKHITYERVDGEQLSALRKNLTTYLDEKFNEKFDKRKPNSKYD